METRSIPITADLWPKVYPVASHRPTGGRLTLEVPGLSEAPLLTALSRAIHLEMRAAGEWAARVGEPRQKGAPGPIDFCRYRRENAARLLALYTAIHGSAGYVSALDLQPEALKASASRSYANALHSARTPRPSSCELHPPTIPKSKNPTPLHHDNS